MAALKAPSPVLRQRLATPYKAKEGGRGQRLTPKMVTFIDAYFGEANFNATRAIELSAYEAAPGRNSTFQAVELMKHPLVMAEIKRRQSIRTEKSELKAEYLIDKLMQMIEDNQIDNPTAALRAIELAGKSIALWKERQEISGPDGEAIKHEQHVKESVAAFTSRVAGLAKRAGTSNVVEFPEPGSDNRA